MKIAPAQSISMTAGRPFRLSDHGYWKGDTVMQTLTIRAPARDVLCKPRWNFQLLTKDISEAKVLSQFYTSPKLAARSRRRFRVSGEATLGTDGFPDLDAQGRAAGEAP